jgi:hypothetical protein
MKEIRTIEEILNEANNTNDLQELINLWNEIAKNKKKYALTEILEANAIIRERALKSNGSDFDKGKFYNDLKSQIPDTEFLFKNL